MIDDDVSYRFWSKVRVRSSYSCWPWTGHLDSWGRGRFRLGGRETPKVFAHRLAYELSNDTAIPEEMMILHSCDNPACCNPSHLRIGTHEDNMRDMRERGRSLRNNRNGAKLTAEDVEWVRSTNMSQTALAQCLGVSRSTICEIVNGKIWR